MLTGKGERRVRFAEEPWGREKQGEFLPFVGERQRGRGLSAEGEEKKEKGKGEDGRELEEREEGTKDRRRRKAKERGSLLLEPTSLSPRSILFAE